MRDYAREENGAQIVMATCVDERFPPENMLDGKDSTFWMTTGMFPQEFVVALRTGVHVSKITTLSLNGRVYNGTCYLIRSHGAISADAFTCSEKACS
jgi:heat shock protein beta-11